VRGGKEILFLQVHMQWAQIPKVSTARECILSLLYSELRPFVLPVSDGCICILAYAFSLTQLTELPMS
jgi:hypothetical protein